MRSAVIIGCGYTGLRLARALSARAVVVTATTRTQERADAIAAAGANPLICDLDAAPPALGSACPDIVFYLAPPPRHGTEDPRLIRYLATLPDREPPRIVYVGTSGVYGDCGGDWVAEDRPPCPDTDRAHRRLAAERALMQWSETGVILRVAGIYGPGRLPIERVRERRPVLAAAEAPWTNRIHVDDLVATLLAAATRGWPGGAYNVADGAPAKAGALERELARQLGLPRPPEIDWQTARDQFSAMRLSFLRASRRLRVARMRDELGVTPRYPDVGAGVAASLAAGD